MNLDHLPFGSYFPSLVLTPPPMGAAPYIWNTVTVNTELSAAAALADNTTNPTTSLIGACLLGYDGTTWDRIQVGAGTAAAALRATLASDDRAVTALEIMDDWDETNRCAVNPISGQVGVQGGSGTVSALTQRVVLATDVALPAGTNAIGKLAPNSGVDIGDVDVTSIVPGTGATNLGKAEDAAHASGDVGVLMLSVRNDTAASTASDIGDYAGLITDSTGRLWCNVSNTVEVASHAVTNAGIFAVQLDGFGLASLQLIDDPVFADDAGFTVATSKVFAVGFLADETSTDSVDEGDVGIARMTLDRKIHVVNEETGATQRIAGTEYTVKRLAIAAASSGENTLVGAVSSKKIRVLSLAVIAAGAVNLYFNNATDGAVFGGSTNKINLPANGGFVLPHNPHGWFQTGTNNEALRVNLSGAVVVSGGLTYVEV